MGDTYPLNDLRQAQARKNAVLALKLAFIAAAPGVLAGIVMMTASITITRYIQMVLFLPAMFMGARIWCRSTSFARSMPVVACVLMVWIGYMYASPQSIEGLEFIAQVTVVLPVAALIVECGAWMLCARTYVYANVPVLITLFVVEYQRHGLDLFLGVHRFGLVYIEEEGIMVANPNAIGGQFAFVAVLALAVVLRTGASRARQLAGRLPKGFSLAWPMIFAFSCLLTGSRGASAALGVGTGTLLMGGMKSQHPSRIRDLLMVMVLAASLLATLAATNVFAMFTPWRTLAERWVSSENVDTVGNRTLIWRTAYDAWKAESFRMVLGTGTGAAPMVLGHYCADATPRGGQYVKSSHSVYVEWGLSFGLVGLIPAICLVLAMLWRARRLDRLDGTSTRLAILLCAGLWAAVSCIHRHPSSLATGSLILAMLSDLPAKRPRSRPRPPAAACEPARPPLRARVWETAPACPAATSLAATRSELCGGRP